MESFKLMAKCIFKYRYIRLVISVSLNVNLHYVIYDTNKTN